MFITATYTYSKISLLRQSLGLDQNGLIKGGLNFGEDNSTKMWKETLKWSGVVIGVGHNFGVVLMGGFTVSG